MQLNPVQRRSDELPQSVPYTHQSDESLSFEDRLTGFNSSNWILDLPDSLIEMKDFHFAISASFRMAQSMGEEFLFDEVR